MSVTIRRDDCTVVLLQPPAPRLAAHGAIGLALAIGELVLLVLGKVPSVDIAAALRRQPAALAELRELPTDELGRMLVDLLALAATVVPPRSLSRWVVTEQLDMLCGVYPAGVEPTP